MRCDRSCSEIALVCCNVDRPFATAGSPGLALMRALHFNPDAKPRSRPSPTRRVSQPDFRGNMHGRVRSIDSRGPRDWSCARGGHCRVWPTKHPQSMQVEPEESARKTELGRRVVREERRSRRHASESPPLVPAPPGHAIGGESVGGLECPAPPQARSSARPELNARSQTVALSCVLSASAVARASSNFVVNTSAESTNLTPKRHLMTKSTPSPA